MWQYRWNQTTIQEITSLLFCDKPLIVHMIQLHHHIQNTGLVDLTPASADLVTLLQLNKAPYNTAALLHASHPLYSLQYDQPLCTQCLHQRYKEPLFHLTCLSSEHYTKLPELLGSDQKTTTMRLEYISTTRCHNMRVC